MTAEEAEDLGRIAVVGLSARFPGAPDADAYWSIIRDGVETVTYFTPEQLRAVGVPDELIANPEYVPAKGYLEDADCFDARLFSIPPGDAELLDPQHRVFLEAAYAALEDAAIDPFAHPGPIGVFAGASATSYLIANLLANPEVSARVGIGQLLLGTQNDFLATRTAYKLNLRGPALTIASACSTSLVAVHYAAQALLAGECDVALAGGVSVTCPLVRGYLFEPMGICSSDGHTRTFDGRADGTVPSNGAGVVVLKRLDDAIDDGDAIRAVILGSAVTNDGNTKIGFTAPSVDGQARAATEALAVAGVAPHEVDYIEAHGTATRAGDPIEVASLAEAYGAAARASHTIALSSVKTNIGHTDSAAGVSGLIKAVLAVEHATLPPSLHFESPNPEIDLAALPFRIQTEAAPWPETGRPRRAAVNSMGMGGTNAHVVLQEAPVRPTRPRRDTRQLLRLSARTDAALDAMAARLADHLAAHPDLDLADVAHTLRVGRIQHRRRRAVVVGQGVPADIATLTGSTAITGEAPGSRPVVFVLPGQGTQHPGMGQGLYRRYRRYREVIDDGAELLGDEIGFDLRTLLYPAPGDEAAAAERLRETAHAQPALFLVETALARLLGDFGVTPTGLLGHSVGEYTAAHLAGTFSFEDALRVLARRGALMQALPGGAMLSVAVPAEDVEGQLGPDLSIAAVNEDASCVVSGPNDLVDHLQEKLSGAGVPVRRLQTSHAFHSPMLEPMLPAFAEALAEVAPRWQAPATPWVSNVTGEPITADQATSVDYWLRHTRSCVRFGAGLATLLADQPLVVEVGPGRVVAPLANRLAPASAVSAMRHATETAADDEVVLLQAVGTLWTRGAAADGPGDIDATAYRVPLPAYPFERVRYWVEPTGPVAPGYGDNVGWLQTPPDEARVGSYEPVATLAAPAAAAGAAAAPAPEVDEPSSEIERVVLDVWRELFGAEPLDDGDDFFTLGGDSLLAARMVTRLVGALGVELTVPDIFEALTASGVTQLIEDRILAAMDGADPA